ncbi:MAG: class I SAM-dependent methyltransferase, partial [Phycisphaerae bacterium]|nr:class I SAM-dependent methyltransferase [Phycisphaerae bacterium]
DAVAFEVYRTLLADLGVRTEASALDLLDVGSGSGRWIRFFQETLRPRQLVGTDFSAAAIELLERWHGDAANTRFRVADITAADLDLEGPFDLINVANVLFHVPEPDKFARALANLHRLLAPNGVVMITEFLPRATMRTDWMLVRSRYEFEAAIKAAGLRISAVRGIGFFGTDPMGIDGPDDGVRHQFCQVRAQTRRIIGGCADDASRRVLTELMINIERAALAYVSERVAPVDTPGQKLVALRRR